MGPTPQELKRAARVFRALAHPARLELACRMARRPAPITQKELVEELGWPQSTMARYIAELRGCGLVVGERRGVEVRLRVPDSTAADLIAVACGWVQPDGNGRVREPGARDHAVAAKRAHDPAAGRSRSSAVTGTPAVARRA